MNATNTPIRPRIVAPCYREEGGLAGTGNATGAANQLWNVT